jgi:hypothetical protein
MQREPYIDDLLCIADALVRQLLRASFQLEPDNLLDPSLRKLTGEETARLNHILAPVDAYIAFVQTGNTKSAEENSVLLDELCEAIFKGIQKAEFQVYLL